jgi:hypothetical protein
MNFLKKAGKTMSKAAKSAMTGLELEGLKVRRKNMTERFEQLQKKHEEYKKCQEEASLLLIARERNEQMKTEYVAKLNEEPLNTVLRETYQQIIDSLTAANEALLRCIADFQEKGGVITFVDDSDEKATTDVERKAVQGVINMIEDVMDSSSDSDSDKETKTETETDDAAESAVVKKDTTETQEDETKSKAAAAAVVVAVVNDEYYETKKTKYEKELKKINDRLSELRAKNK